MSKLDNARCGGSHKFTLSHKLVITFQSPSLTQYVWKNRQRTHGDLGGELDLTTLQIWIIHFESRYLLRTTHLPPDGHSLAEFDVV